MNEQISELIPPIAQFGSIYTTPSVLRAKEQQAIQMKIVSIINYCDDILQKVYVSLDQFRVQDIKFASYVSSHFYSTEGTSSIRKETVGITGHICKKRFPLIVRDTSSYEDGSSALLMIQR